MSYLQSLDSQKIAVVGAGVTGKAILQFLDNRNIKADVYDDKAPGALREVSANYDLAIISPGWKLDHPIVLALQKSSKELIGEIDFSWRVQEEIAPDQKWIGLTGTNGKTTTIQMVQSILEASSVSGVACGNVGEPVISVLGSGNHYDILAIELSSFQLEWSNLPRFVACAILNIAPDHIDWHGSFDRYAFAKLRILDFSDQAIINAQDPETMVRSSSWRGSKAFYSLDTPQAGEIGLVDNLLIDRAFTGDPSQAVDFAELSDIKPTVPHNVSNAMAAAGLALAVGLTHDDVRHGLKNFTLDHHRLESVLEQDGVTWINDSKATNPHAASAALMSQLSAIWIAGGLAKGAAMDNLVKRCAGRIKSAILIGQDASVIATALSKYAPHIPYIIMPFDGNSQNLMRDVVLKAQELSSSGDTVLLAPACASMDQFRDYADRGETFANMVREVVGK